MRSDCWRVQKQSKGWQVSGRDYGSSLAVEVGRRNSQVLASSPSSSFNILSHYRSMGKKNKLNQRIKGPDC